MQQMIDEAGNIWNVDAQGNPVSFAGNANQGGGVQIRPADPTMQYDLQKAQADAAKASADAAIAGQMNQVQLAKAQADLAKAQAEKGGDQKADQRLANLRALKENIARVRQLYAENLKGGLPNQFTALVPDFINPRLGQFDSAGAGLGETGLAAFRVPGVGAQSDTELRAFIDANRPESTDSDLKIEEKLRNLETRLNATLEALGQPVEQQSGPTVLPRAAGAKADPGIGPTGVTPEGGLRYEQGLAGLPDAVANMVAKGAQPSEITAFLNEQYAPFGASVGPDMAAAIGTLVQRHRADPRAPVKSLNTGWDNFAMLPGRQQSTMLGRAADTDLGNFAMHAANAATAGLPGYLAGDQGAAVLDASAQSRPLSSLAGEVTGGTAALLGLNSAAGALGRAGQLLRGGGGIGGDVLYGTTRGGLENGPTGAITGAVAAGVGNRLGTGLANTTGRIVRGVSDPAVNALAERGIPMSLGSLLGNRSIPGKMINRFESAPIIGDMFAARRADSIDAFNREAFNDAVSPLGGSVRSPGREGMNEALGIVDEGYRNALGDAAVDTADPGFRDALTGARARMEGIPTIGQELSYNYDNNVAPLFEGGLNGERLQSALRSLREMQAGYAGKPMGQAARDAVGEAEGAVRNLVQSQRPDVLPKFDAANAAYRNVSTLADAVNAATNNKGVFTPAQLGRSAVNNTKKFGGRMKAARGDVPFAELQAAAQDVLPSAYPDSGTAGRLLSAALPTVLGGGGLAAGTLADPTTAATLGALALLSSKSGAKIAQKALTGRSPAARAIGTKLVNQRRKAGLFGASAGVAMLPQFSQ